MDQRKNMKKSQKSDERYIRINELKPGMVPTREDVVRIYGELKQRQASGTDRDVLTVSVPYSTGVSSDGSGTVQTVLSNDPNNSVYWTSIFANYEEYRVLGIRLEYEPYFLTGGSTLIQRAPLTVVTDFDSSAALTSYALAKSYSNQKSYRSDQRFTIMAVDENTEAADWNNSNTAAPVSSFWIKFFSTTNSASTVLGVITLEYIVQLKNRGV